MRSIIDKLKNENNLSDDEYLKLITEDIDIQYLYTAADEVRQKYYGKKVFLRGLIEISNYCKNDCLYCGIRKSNKCAERYRLSKEDIYACCDNGYELGFRTFVLQGGEDAYYTDDVMCEIIKEIKHRYPECAITLSLGERGYDSYKKMFDAGADRYLLRHETSEEEHYAKLHPENMSLTKRKECLFNLKKIGYQTGSGFMVGSPYQKPENLVSDIRFLQELKPDMIGIGPFIKHKDTPFANFESGTYELTLRMLSVLRLTFPKVLLPATTALGTIHPQGRELGLKAGANVVMPNITEGDYRKQYEIYPNKICVNESPSMCRNCISAKIKSIGRNISQSKGFRCKI